MPQELQQGVQQLNSVGVLQGTYFNKHLVQFNQRHIPPQTLPTAVPENNFQRCFHLVKFISRAVKPPLRAKDVRILAPYFLVPKQSPSTVTNFRAFRYVKTVKGITSRRDLLRHKASHRRKYAEPFFDHCLQVRHCPCFGILDWGGWRDFSYLGKEFRYNVRTC